MSGLLWYLAETGAALAVFYAVYRLALKNDTHFQTGRLYLLASLVAAHLVPLFHITSPFRRVVVRAGPLGDIDVPGTSVGGWEWQQLLLWLYAAGAAFVFVRLAWHLAQLVVIARRHDVVHRDGVRVVYVDEDCPPFSFFRTAFVHRPAEGDEQVLDQVVATSGRTSARAIRSTSCSSTSRPSRSGSTLSSGSTSAPCRSFTNTSPTGKSLRRASTRSPISRSCSNSTSAPGRSNSRTTSINRKSRGDSP